MQEHYESFPMNWQIMFLQNYKSKLMLLSGCISAVNTNPLEYIYCAKNIKQHYKKWLEIHKLLCVMGSVCVLTLRASLCYIIKFKVTWLPSGLLYTK